MDFLPIIDIKQEENYTGIEDSGEYFDIGFDVKVKVENASPTSEIDWCVDNSAVFGNNNYINVYDDLIEYSEQECLICHKKFDDLYSLFQHNLTHLTINLSSSLGSYRHHCKTCYTYFQSADKLKAHRKQCVKSSSKRSSVSIVKNMRQCEECGKVLPYRSWHSHIREVHGGDKAFCHLCNKVFKCQRYFQRHMMFIHDGKKPSWRFRTISDSEERKCELCPAILKNKHALKTHINNCHSTGEFCCDICHAKFKSKPYLRTHMNRVHDGNEKKYLCSCGKSYRSPRRLRIHRKNTICGDI